MKNLFVTQASGIPEETPFIESHRAYANRHNLDHRIVTDLPMPPWMFNQYANPYKFAKPFIMLEALSAADYVLFSESDVMITDFDRLPPIPKEGSWLRAGTCRAIEDQLCICPCTMCAVKRDQALEFFQASIDMLQAGFPDGGPFDEILFHEVQKKHGPTGWDLDTTLCSYHNATYRDHSTRPWQPGDRAIHISGVPWPHKHQVFLQSVNTPPLGAGLSVIVAVQNRADRLRASLPSWLLHPAVREVIVVDYGSDAPLGQLIPHFLQDPRVKLFRVENPGPFNLGRAYNVALSHVTCDTIVKIDADYVLSDPSLLDEVYRLRNAGHMRSHYISGHHALRDPQLSGFIIADTRIMRAEGYREDFEGWGHDDEDLYSRLSARHNLRRDVRKGLDNQVVHLPHREEWITPEQQNTLVANQERSSALPARPNRLYNVVARPNTNVVVMAEIPPAPTKHLMNPEDFAPIFEQWRGKNVHYYFDPSQGNAGDTMIWSATRQLFEFFEMRECGWNEAEVAMWPGGGSMGGLYPPLAASRKRFFHTAAARGIPSVLLPQTWSAEDDSADVADFIYARDPGSLEFCPRAELSHDLALALRMNVFPHRESREHGLFLREDVETQQAGRPNIGDPATLPRLASHPGQNYLQHASMYRSITTDRLHFAIAGLLVGAKVTLLPNSYHKNRSVFAHSLEAFGCLWAETIDASLPGL